MQGHCLKPHLRCDIVGSREGGGANKVHRAERQWETDTCQGKGFVHPMLLVSFLTWSRQFSSPQASASPWIHAMQTSPSASIAKGRCAQISAYPGTYFPMAFCGKVGKEKADLGQLKEGHWALLSGSEISCWESPLRGWKLVCSLSLATFGTLVIQEGTWDPQVHWSLCLGPAF